MTALAAFFYNFIVLINEVFVPLLFAVAFFIFIFGVFRFFIAGGANEEKRKEGQKFITWGIIGFVLMFSIWGIVNLIVNSLGFNTQTRPDLPIFGGYFGSNYGIYGSPTDQRTINDPNLIVQPGQQGCSVLGMSIGSCPRGLDCQQGICRNVDGT